MTISEGTYCDQPNLLMRNGDRVPVGDHIPVGDWPWSHQHQFSPQLFAFLGFLTSALWINAAATEVVNILRSLGVVFRLSNTVLGLTLLAWGNSIGGDSGSGGALG